MIFRQILHNTSLFFVDQGCLGMTYDPNLGKWTLRPSSEPKDSITNEVSMTKECVDAIGNNTFTSSYTDLSFLLYHQSIFHVFIIIFFKHLGLPRFTIEGNRYCYDDKMQEFESLEEATNACENDESCAGIWDDKCDGTHFWTCKNKRQWDDYSRTSCIHRKNSGMQLKDIPLTNKQRI